MVNLRRRRAASAHGRSARRSARGGEAREDDGDLRDSQRGSCDREIVDLGKVGRVGVLEPEEVGG